jgi:hypothetical protein
VLRSPAATGRCFGAAAFLALAAASTATAQVPAADRPFTVGNYPVEAHAQDAVTAKEQAVADGQRAAFRSLLKRLVPVTAYARLRQLSSVKAADLIDGVAVRAERNSPTSYVASLDFTFQAKAVRALLRRESIPYVDAQAPAVTVVPVVQPGGAASAKPWNDAWRALDLDNALTPVKIEAARPSLKADTVSKVAAGDGAGLRALAGEYRTDLVLLAILEADTAAGRLHVTLAGNDAVGSFTLKRSYRMAPGDLAYTAELAAVVALGMLEGRWKATKVRTTKGGVPALSAAPQPVHLMVEFRNLQHWNQIRRQIEETPGVEDLQVGGLSARGADVALRFPGGGAQLADSLIEQGLDAGQSGGTLIVRSRH